METERTQAQLNRYNKIYDTNFRLKDKDENGNIDCVNCFNRWHANDCYRHTPFDQNYTGDKNVNKN